MAENISVGLLGLGTVGSGVVRIIENHQDKLMHQVGCSVDINKVLVKDMKKARKVKVDEGLLTSDPYEVLDNPDIDVVIEVMGGIEESRGYILHALNNKKHVVTANKDLMALHGTELLKAAAENECDLFYEASVAGGIPILRSLVEGLASDRIKKMMGIVNGTTNYILTKMSQEGRAYDDVLKEAQELGYAESDPTADVSGLDAARKMAIMATLGFSMNMDLDDVEHQGIENVTEEDIKYGKQLGYTMKLIGIADRVEDKAEVSVQPAFLPEDHPLSSVHNEFNAVYVYGEAVGETMFYGPGAGELPTATAVVSDLVEVIKNKRLGVNGQSAVTPQYPKKLKESSEVFAQYFFRLHVIDEAGVLARITTLFADEGVSFEKILQLPLKEKGTAELVLITHTASKSAYENIKQRLEEADAVLNVKSVYRVEGGRES
ncbi:homoserine dehydrogenase [Bacillus marinisedimentorum]|uniref:homoserine dehydrogenase n=1 Tax=Bacillus marinisedimentorum TaxID=1821260 RepID=UPI000872D804|nr:homoserine dehydrogenase [Bacillus marinisedimentorum]